MADVRSMLRAERQNRRIQHPHASYTTDGKLLCNLCETKVKSEAAWQAHLHSTQHTLRTTRANEAAKLRTTESTGSKKRKASDVESPPPEERKKAKAEPVEPPECAPSLPLEETTPVPEPTTNAPEPTPVPGEEGMTAAELDAFELELAAMERSMPGNTALNAAPTISAAPMTAEEVAAQAREEQSAQRNKRDAEIEGERADATRLLEDEFEEMEGLEARIQKLRERREALRTEATTGAVDAVQAAGDEEKVEAGAVESAKDADVNGKEGEEDGEEDEDEDFDDWKFGSK